MYSYERRFLTKFKKDEIVKLAEAEVIRIYNRCLITDPDLENNKSRNKVTTRITSSDKTAYITFDYDMLEEEEGRLRYMLGQLFYTHYYDRNRPNDLLFKPSVGCVNYKNEPWTKNQKILYAFYYLQIAETHMSKFGSDNIAEIRWKINDIIPTLSPDDPNFAQWYKEWSKENVE